MSSFPTSTRFKQKTKNNTSMKQICLIVDIKSFKFQINYTNTTFSVNMSGRIKVPSHQVVQEDNCS